MKGEMESEDHGEKHTKSRIFRSISYLRYLSIRTEFYVDNWCNSGKLYCAFYILKIQNTFHF